MITGTVRDGLEAIIELEVTGPAGSAVVSAVLDTGYTGRLCLPVALAASLGLGYVSRGVATLADGSKGTHDVFRADVTWFGVPRRMLVPAAGDVALVGMVLLAGCELRMEVTPGGAVEVRLL